jgi:hypothetical protein
MYVGLFAPVFLLEVREEGGTPRGTRGGAARALSCIFFRHPRRPRAGQRSAVPAGGDGCCDTARRGFRRPAADSGACRRRIPPPARPDHPQH